MYDPNKQRSEREQPYKETTQYEDDGTSKVHWGGMGGTVEYDKHGNQR